MRIKAAKAINHKPHHPALFPESYIDNKLLQAGLLTCTIFIRSSHLAYGRNSDKERDKNLRGIITPSVLTAAGTVQDFHLCSLFIAHLNVQTESGAKIVFEKDCARKLNCKI